PLVRLPQKAKYTSKSAPPTLVHHSDQTFQQLAISDSRWRRVVLHRFMTENGGIVFALGTKFGGTVTRDKEDVPLSQIYDFVTPDELRRFENQDYDDEDERERMRLLNMKPRGRSRKDPQINVSLLTPSQGFSGQGYAAFRAATDDGTVKKKRGRPKGWRKNRLPSGNGPVPSFNGPQPTGEAESTLVKSTTRRTGVYSMVAASGLVPIGTDSEIETSRDITPLPAIDDERDQSSSKRRRMDQSTIHVPNHFSSGPNSTSSTSSARLASNAASNVAENMAEVEDSIAEGQALLPQLNTSDRAERGHQRQSSISSNDSLLSTIVYKPRPQPIQSQPAGPLDPLTPMEIPRRRRTSLPPHFPGSGSKIPAPNSEEWRALSGAATSPVTVRKVEQSQDDAPIYGGHPSLKRSRKSSPAKQLGSRPSTATSTSSLGPKQRDAYNDISAYFSPRAKPTSASPRPQVATSTNTPLQAFLSTAPQKTRPTPSSPWTFASSLRNSTVSQHPHAKGPAEQDSSSHSESEAEHGKKTSIIRAQESRYSPEPSSSASECVSSFIPVTQPSAMEPLQRTLLTDSIDPRIRGSKNLDQYETIGSDGDDEAERGGCGRSVCGISPTEESDEK
ncbi:MAG: hypothetical protein Q9217_006798, partial [Psora testacea]